MTNIYPSDIKSIIQNDEFNIICKNNWNKLDRLFKRDFNDEWQLWADKGEEFENNEANYFINLFGIKNVLHLSRKKDFDYNYKKTINAMNKGIPLIIEAHLKYTFDNIELRSKCDMIIRSDYLKLLNFKKYPKIFDDKTKVHYIPIDFKIASLKIYDDKDFELSSTHKFNHIQLLFSIKLLEKIQGYCPKFGFNISGNGPKIKKTKYKSYDCPCVVYNKCKKKYNEKLYNSFWSYINRVFELKKLVLPDNITKSKFKKFIKDNDILVNCKYDKDCYINIRKELYPKIITEDQTNLIKQFFLDNKKKCNIIDNDIDLIISIDNEFIPNMSITKTGLTGRLVYLIGITIYDIKNNSSIYKYFYADKLDFKDEKKIVNNFGKYLNKITDNGSKKYLFCHWHNPEIIDFKNWINKYEFNKLCPHFDLNTSLDLMKYLKQIDKNKILKNNLSYGLKNVTKFLCKYKNELQIKNIKDWSDDISGKSTIMLRIYNNHNIKSKLIRYNENDCDTVLHILLYL